MAIEPMLAAAAPPPAPSRSPGWAVFLAACLPLGACPVAPAMFAASAGARDAPDMVRDGGLAAYLVLLVFVVATLAAAFTCALLARGSRVPAAVPLFLAALPWLVGDAGLRMGIRMVVDVLGQVDPADRATIMAAGIGEITVNRFMGSLFASVLFGFVGLALAVAALGQSTQKSPLGLGVGLAAAAPMVGAALFVPSLRESGVVGFIPALPAFAALAGLTVAAWSASADAPRARSAALAAACGAAFGLAFSGAAVASVLSQLIGTFRALAHVGPADRATIGLMAAAEMRPGALLATWGWALAAVPALAVGGWSVMRGAAVKAPVGALVASAAVLGLVAAADFSASRATNDTIELVAVKPWAHVPGFQPVVLPGGQAPLSEVGAVVLPDRWVNAGGGGFDKPFDSPEQLGEALKPVALPRERHISDTYDEGKMTGKKPVPQYRRLGLALDARLTSKQLGTLFAAAATAGAVQLDLIGARQGAAAPSSPYDPTAWLAKVLDIPTGVELRLLRDDLRDDLLAQRVEVGAEGLLTPLGDHPQLVMLVPTEAMSPRGLYVAIDKVREANAIAAWPTDFPIAPALKALMVSGKELERLGLLDVMGKTDPAFAEALKAEIDAMQPSQFVGMPNRMGMSGHHPAQDNMTEGAPTVMGALDKELIRKVMHQHRTRFRYCYEKRLTQLPRLAGKVTLKFVISSAGTVVQAAVAETSVKDKELEDCMVGHVRQAVFPKPHGGGVVIVTWPVTFRQPD